jgi:hypothetical protein
MEVPERLRERIGDINDFSRPRPLVTLEEFFKGNTDPGSIGYNLPDHPTPDRFHAVLSAIAARPDVADVRVEVKDWENEDGWPSADTVWIFTTASAADVWSWFPNSLAPDEWGVRELDASIEPYPVPPGMRAVYAFYD